MKSCPSCNFETENNEPECRACGLIFEKWSNRQQPRKISEDNPKVESTDDFVNKFSRFFLLVMGVVAIYMVLVGMAFKFGATGIPVIFLAVLSTSLLIWGTYPNLANAVLAAAISVIFGGTFGGDVPFGIRLVVVALWIFPFAISRVFKYVFPTVALGLLVCMLAVALVLTVGLIKKKEAARQGMVILSIIYLVKGLLTLPLLLPFGIVIIPMLASPDPQARRFVSLALLTVFGLVGFMGWVSYYLTRPNIKAIFKGDRAQKAI